MLISRVRTLTRTWGSRFTGVECTQHPLHTHTHTRARARAHTHTHTCHLISLCARLKLTPRLSAFCPWQTDCGIRVRNGGMCGASRGPNAAAGGERRAGCCMRQSASVPCGPAAERDDQRLKGGRGLARRMCNTLGGCCALKGRAKLPVTCRRREVGTGGRRWLCFMACPCWRGALSSLSVVTMMSQHGLAEGKRKRRRSGRVAGRADRIRS